jgi:hypothetical protein
VPLTIAKAASATSLTLSPARVTYGAEQAGHLSVTVAPQYRGTPDGTVTVKAGTATACTITLAAGHGSCTLTAVKLPAGAQRLTATYSGSASFAPSASPAMTLTVARATSRTTLSLSTARVSYGREQAERMTVTVTPQYGGTPDGKATIKAGPATICTITLTAGKGTCTLTARQLRTAAYTLVATYPGTSNFTSSASARKTLTVVR